MKTKAKLTAVLMLALAGAFAAVAQQQSLTGIVTDSMCGTAHMAKDKTPCRMYPNVRERRHEVRSGRGEKGLYLGRTRRGTRQTRWPESHGQGNSEG
jgi:hypothetical protein